MHITELYSCLQGVFVSNFDRTPPQQSFNRSWYVLAGDGIATTPCDYCILFKLFTLKSEILV